MKQQQQQQKFAWVFAILIVINFGTILVMKCMSLVSVLLFYYFSILFCFLLHSVLRSQFSHLTETLSARTAYELLLIWHMRQTIHAIENWRLTKTEKRTKNQKTNSFTKKIYHQAKPSLNQTNSKSIVFFCIYNSSIETIQSIDLTSFLLPAK